MSCTHLLFEQLAQPQYLEFPLSTLLEIPKWWHYSIFTNSRSQIQVLISKANFDLRRLAGTCKYFIIEKVFTLHFLYCRLEAGRQCDRSELICCSHVLDFSVEWLLMSFRFSHFYGQASCSLEEGCLHALKKDCTIHWHNLGTTAPYLGFPNTSCTFYN